jgi:hypothetical protein
VERLNATGKELLKTLERTFPFLVEIGPGGGNRSIWRNEKVHSILHGPRNLMRMGRSKNISCKVTETRHQGVKIKGTKANRKPGSMGLSFIKQEVREADMQGLAWLAMKLDRYASGPRRVRRLPGGRHRLNSHGGVAIHGPESSGSESDPSPAPVLTAMRYFERDGDEKTQGCLGDGVRCNVWARAKAVQHID